MCHPRVLLSSRRLCMIHRARQRRTPRPRTIAWTPLCTEHTPDDFVTTSGRLHVPRWWALWMVLVACGAQACTDGLPVGVLAPIEDDVTTDVDVGPGEDVLVPEVALRILSPAEGAEVADETLRVHGRSEGPVASVWVRAGRNLPQRARSTDGFRTWEVELATFWGAHTLVATALNGSGEEVAREEVSLLGVSPADPGLPLDLVILSPAEGEVMLFPSVLLEGTTSGPPVERIEVELNGERLSSTPVATEDQFRTWVAELVLIPGDENQVTVRAFSLDGDVAVATRTLIGRPALSRGDPVLGWLPTPPRTVEAETLELSGILRAPNGVRRLEVRAGVPEPAAPARTLWDPWSTQVERTEGRFSAKVDLRPGLQRFEIRVVDALGLAARLEVEVSNQLPVTLGPERSTTLRVRDERPPVVHFSLDRQQVDEVFQPEVQEQVTLLELDLQPLLRNVLDEVKTACGTAWREDRSNPRHDCSLTPLGRTFVGQDGTWQSSPEYAMVRLLTMTPANVQVSGTSIAGLQELTDTLGIGGGFSEILADALGIPRTQEIVSTASVVEALRAGLVATHPGTTEEGLLPLTLRDAQLDLAPLGVRFGPDGDHPGILDPDDPPRAALFDDTFRMVLGARSNLRWSEGLVLGVDKEYLARLPAGVEDVLQFDFLDPARFNIEGLIPEPRVDLRFVLEESPLFIPSCNGNAACRQNLPGAPLNAQSLWAQPPWLVESIIVRAAWESYRERRVSLCYLLCLARVQIGQGSLPAGWTVFSVPLSIGNPPRDQYVWELITEIGQVALHRTPGGTIPEGEANMAFTLRDVPVGIAADELLSAIRPFLQGQAARLSSLLLGEWRETNGAPDFVLHKAATGELVLVFSAPTDPLPAAVRPHRRPGFFSSPTLEAESRVSVSGPDARSPWPNPFLVLSPGEQVVWAEDRAGGVYRLRIEVPAAGSNHVIIHHARWFGP